MDQLMLAIITTLFIVAVIFILLGTEKHHKHLKKVISLQDSTIKSLRDENRALHEKVESKERYIVNLAANNAVMKQTVVNLESSCNNLKEWLGIIKLYDIEITQDDEGKIVGVSREKIVNKEFSMEEEISTLKQKIKELESKLALKEEPTGPKIHLIGAIKKQKPKNKTTKKNLILTDEVGYMQQKTFKKEDITSANLNPIEFNKSIEFKTPKKRKIKKNSNWIKENKLYDTRKPTITQEEIDKWNPKKKLKRKPKKNKK